MRHLPACSRLSIAVALCILASAAVKAQTASFVAPPRTIADITAILDQQKPDPGEVARLSAAADAEPPVGVAPAVLARFYYDRGQARSTLGRNDEAILDAKEALASGQGVVDRGMFGTMQQFIATQYLEIGDYDDALEVFLEIERTVRGPQSAGRLANTYWHLVDLYISLGDLARAEAYVQKGQVLLQQIRNSGETLEYRAVSVECDVASAAGSLLVARGQFREAEAFLRRAELLRREAALLSSPNAPPRAQQERAADLHAAALSRAETRQGRTAEGEADMRRALLNRLKATGKYNLQATRFVGLLATSLVEQGRYVEAEKLVRSQIEIYRTFKIAKSVQFHALAMSNLASILSLQGRFSEATSAYAELDEATRGWEPARREGLGFNTERVFSLYGTDDLAAAMAATERLLASDKARYGDQNADTAMARGLLGLGLARVGRDADALREFRIAIPILDRGLWRDTER